ncbi:MAG: hypothetical protein NXI01_01855 [Gammaproteobacteria bacterium]|nr:hypothetical protein [Gammaproteobacteria bacterium]
MTTILCVDLDGTLILVDTMQEAIWSFLGAHPFQCWRLLLWLCRGRAYLKQKLGQYVALEPSLLPYHEPFLAWLKERKKAGDTLVLATATDQTFAIAIASYLGLFDDVLASNGRVNLRAQSKAAALNERYGVKGYDYAGNSCDDLKVWSQARHAIVVNASRCVERRARTCCDVTHVFG